MTPPTGEVVRGTFLEFWPPQLQHAAPDQTAIELSSEEYGAVRRCHRSGRPDGADSDLISDVARRALSGADTAACPVFLRMGYGSWALPQWRQFGTLAVSSVERAEQVLALADRRLAEISRRYVSGFTPKLYVRSFLDFSLDQELRFVVNARRVVSVNRRHAIGEEADATSPPDLGQGWITPEILNALPEAGSFSIDAVRIKERTIILDLNPRT